MKYLVMSDVHANIDALEAVLAAAAGKYDRVLLLGDMVGYGATPNEVVARLRQLDIAAAVRGNHEKAIVSGDTSSFTPHAAAAAEWTIGEVSDDTMQWLAALPAGPVLVSPKLEICHGSPADEDAYADEYSAGRALYAARAPLCLCGHTHVPMNYVRDFGSHVRGRRLVNFGSVGQPRDGQSTAAFGLVDSQNRVTFLRAAYDVAAAQQRILAAGLPSRLAARLSRGD